MQAIVIVNASGGKVSGRAEDCSPEGLREAFARHDLSPEIHYVPANRLLSAVRSAMARRPDALIVGGGDGTIGTAAGEVTGTNTVLGVLPMGTLNHFCKDLGVGADLAGAVKTIAAGYVRAVDIASVNGTFFVNNCSIGAYPDAVRRRESLRQLAGYRKWPAMARALCEVLRDMRRLRVEIEAEGGTRVRRTPLVLVSNNRYAGHLFSKSLRERLDEGRLCVYTTRVDHYLPALRLAALAFMGRLEEADEFECWTAREVLLSVPGCGIQIAVDGEVRSLSLPLRITLHPGALRVYAPPPTS